MSQSPCWSARVSPPNRTNLLQEIHKQARATAAFSIIAAPDSPAYEQVCSLERLAPPARKRFEAMEKIAQAGVLTGSVCMPVLPELCDTQSNLESVVRWTAEHGGKFVLFGGLTLADQQRDWLMRYLAERMPDLHSAYQRLYPPGSYGPAGDWWLDTACRVHELCVKYGIQDRMPRPIIPGEKRELNKKVVEVLAAKVHTLELDRQPQQLLWAYRKAAWAVEDLEQDISLVYSRMGQRGLQSIRGISQALAAEIIQIMAAVKSEGSAQPAVG